MEVKLRGLDRYEVGLFSTMVQTVMKSVSSFLSVNPIHKSRERS